MHNLHLNRLLCFCQVTETELNIFKIISDFITVYSYTSLLFDVVCLLPNLVIPLTSPVLFFPVSGRRNLA